MKIEMILAVSKNGVIGVENRLPWRLKGELSYFKEKTMGTTLVCGRKTFESFGSRPLPGRDSIILTSQPESLEVKGELKKEKVIPVSSYDQALSEARALGKDVMIIGGSTLYSEFIRKLELGLERVYLTRVHGAFEGDAFFEYSLSDYGFGSKSSDCGIGKEHPDNQYDFTFEVWDRESEDEG